jgi:hypothetical protein
MLSTTYPPVNNFIVTRCNKALPKGLTTWNDGASRSRGRAGVADGGTDNPTEQEPQCVHPIGH